MSKHPTSCRKTTSSFVDVDNSNTINHVQVTPRFNTFVTDRSDHYAVSNPVSNSNLIGDSIFVQEPSRAVSVSKTGQAHLIQLNEDIEKSPRIELVSTTSGKGDGFENSLQFSPHQGFTGLSGPSSHLNENTLNINKRSKAARRHASHKARLTFTPRRAGPSHSMHGLRHTCSTNNMNVETQTNLHLDLFPPRQIKSLNATNLSKNVSTPALSTNTQYKTSSSVHQCQQVTHPLEMIPRPIPTKLYKKSNSFKENYADLRRFVSFLTLLTVMSWFISTYFELEILSELFDNFLERVRNWYLGNEKPKTKMEIFMQFLTEFVN